MSGRETWGVGLGVGVHVETPTGKVGVITGGPVPTDDGRAWHVQFSAEEFPRAWLAAGMRPTNPIPKRWDPVIDGDPQPADEHDEANGQFLADVLRLMADYVSAARSTSTPQEINDRRAAAYARLDDMGHEASVAAAAVNSALAPWIYGARGPNGPREDGS